MVGLEIGQAGLGSVVVNLWPWCHGMTSDSLADVVAFREQDRQLDFPCVEWEDFHGVFFQ